MSNYPLLSLLAMVRQDQTIINDTNFPLPEGMTHENLDPILLAETAELEILYPEPETLKTVIKAWATVRGPSWSKILTALTVEYCPIENYDRNESWTDTHNLTQNISNQSAVQSAGNSTASNTNTESVTGFNSDDWTNKQRDSGSSSGTANNTTNSSGSESRTDTGTLSRTSRVHGNIGVTTNQQMIQAEIELRKTDLYQIITQEFIKMFCLGVY